MKIAILDLTRHPQPLLAGLQRASDQILDWLSPALSDADFTIYDIAEAVDPMPLPDAFDGLILSGSELGVYDDAPWIPSLRQLLIATKQARKLSILHLICSKQLGISIYLKSISKIYI